MFGFRTPAKRSMEAGDKSPEKVDSETSNMKTPEKTSPYLVAVPRVPPKLKSKTLSQDSDGSRKTIDKIRKMTIEAEEVPLENPKYKSRSAEAKACLTKAKINLGNSRNLRADIKMEVTLMIDRLYALVKEAEAEGKEDRNQPSTTYLSRVETSQDKGVECQMGKIKETIGEKLIEKLEKHEKLMKESNEAIEKLKNTLERKATREEKTTYAAVAAVGAQRKGPVQTALHSIVVASKDDQETGEEVLKQIRETVNAKDGWVKVERVRKVKNSRVIVGCATEEERKKVKERLENASDRLNVEYIQNKDPLVMLKDVLNYNTDQDVLNALKNQNRAIFDGLENGAQKLDICFRRKTRNPHASHIVVRVPPKVWQRMTEAGAVHIDLQKVRVADHSPLVQCSTCLGYGHSKRLCTDKIAKCSHCGGPHVRTECADWIANAPPMCCNCTRVGLDSSAEHNAFSQECPVRQKWDALARSSISYC